MKDKEADKNLYDACKDFVKDPWENLLSGIYDRSPQIEKKTEHGFYDSFLIQVKRGSQKK